MFNKQSFGPNFKRDAPLDYSEPDYNMCQKGHCWNFEFGKRCLTKPCGFFHVAREADDKNNTLCVFYAKNSCHKGLDCPFRHDINLPVFNQQPQPNFGPNSFIQQKPWQFQPPPPQSQQFQLQQRLQFPPRQQPQQFQPRQQQQQPQQFQLQHKSQLKPAMKSPGKDERGQEQKVKFSPKFEFPHSSDEEGEIKPKKKTPLKTKAKSDSSDDDEGDKKKYRIKRKLEQILYSLGDDDDTKPQKKQQKHDYELEGSELKRLFSDGEYMIIKKRR